MALYTILCLFTADFPSKLEDITSMLQMKLIYPPSEQHISSGIIQPTWVHSDDKGNSPNMPTITISVLHNHRFCV